MSDTELKLQRIAALLPLLRQLTIKQVIEAGDVAIDAAGLNPWCLKEGLAEGTEPAVSEWRINEAVATINEMPSEPDTQVTALVEAARFYMSQFGQALEANEIEYGPSQIEADKRLRAAITVWEQSNG